MRKKTTKKNSSSKRGSKNVDSWGLRMVKNVGGALPLVGLLVGGAALAGGAVAVSKMSNAEEDGLEVDEDLDRTLQGITLNNTPSITSPSPSTTTSSNTTSASTSSTTSRNNGIGARTGGLQNQTHSNSSHVSSTRTRHGNNSETTARIRSQVSDLMMNEPMDNFERSLSVNQISNIQRMMIRSFNMNAERNGRQEILDDTFADGIIGPSTRALIYVLKRASLTGGNLNSHLDQEFIERLSRHTGMFTGNSHGLGTIKTVSRKRRLR